MRNLLFLLLSTCFTVHAFEPLEKFPRDISLAAIEENAHQRGNYPLLRAVQATKELIAKYKHPGIRTNRFLAAAYFIETYGDEIKNSSSHYLTKKDTGIKHTIEYDPETGYTFIVLNAKKAYLGKGAKKTVYKAILYGNKPRLVARSEQSLEMDDELHALKQFKGSRGILHSIAFTEHKEQNQTFRTVYTDLYEGTLYDVFQNKNVSSWNKLVLMSDLLTGLDTLHSKEYVHRDLHAYNLLFHTEEDNMGRKTLRAVIADLGRTIHVSNAIGVAAQMTRRMRAPEGFSPKKLRGKDYYATDIYALGCILYRLHHNKMPAWQSSFVRSDMISDGSKKVKLAKILREEAGKRREELILKKFHQSTLPLDQEIELLILQMVHVNPADRGSARELLNEMQRIIKSVH